MQVISVNIGKRKTVVWKNKTYETGIYKLPVEQAIFLGKEGVDNDDVIDRKNHGGIDQAVYAYGENHYNYWKNLYPNLEFNYGMFGENLTISNLFEEKLNIGSIYQLGEAKLEVSKPRQPCFKLGIRFKNMNIVKQFWSTTKSGVYFKVLQTGFVAKNDVLVLLEKANNTPSIAEVYKSKKT
ncbi:MAG: MOSC domain-containing protein [Flavobacteriaceae bacterium]|nr:MOSC domain-containing protein [Flavobacteriaceae bacterium]